MFLFMEVSGFLRKQEWRADFEKALVLVRAHFRKPSETGFAGFL